jgi:hypothetical protein
MNPRCREFKEALSAFDNLETLRKEVKLARKELRVAKLPKNHVAVTAHDQGLERLSDALNSLTKAVNTASMADAAKQRFASEPVGLGNSTPQ